MSEAGAHNTVNRYSRVMDGLDAAIPAGRRFYVEAAFLLNGLAGVNAIDAISPRNDNERAKQILARTTLEALQTIYCSLQEVGDSFLPQLSPQIEQQIASATNVEEPGTISSLYGAACLTATRRLLVQIVDHGSDRTYVPQSVMEGYVS